MQSLTSSSETFLTPINIFLIIVAIYITYLQLRPKRAIKLPPNPASIVFRTFTPPTLLPNNGTNGNPVYLAVRSRVFDVTPGRHFYGPGGPYQNFAGRDASRGLAFGSFDEDMLTENLEGPLDTLDDLDADQLEALKGWEETFEGKYMIVGKLVSVEDEKKEEKKEEKEDEKEDEKRSVS